MLHTTLSEEKVARIKGTGACMVLVNNIRAQPAGAISDVALLEGADIKKLILLLAIS